MRWFWIGLTIFWGHAIADEKAIEKAVSGINPTIRVQSIQAIKGADFFEVILQSGERIYANSNASYFVAGDLYKIEVGGIVNITEQSRRTDRQKLLETLKDEDLVVFPPPGKVKHRLLIFTDIDCGYCRKLHDEIENLLKNGVEVRYAAFPRSGLNTPSYFKYVSVVCADDRRTAMTAAKLGDDPETISCLNQVEAQLRLGQQLGISGTPTIIFEDGSMQPGYSPWIELLNRMNQIGS